MHTVHELMHVQNVNTARDARVVAVLRNQRLHVYCCMYRACGVRLRWPLHDACTVVRRARVLVGGDANTSHSNVELDREDDCGPTCLYVGGMGDIIGTAVHVL